MSIRCCCFIVVVCLLVCLFLSRATCGSIVYRQWCGFQLIFPFARWRWHTNASAAPASATFEASAIVLVRCFSFDCAVAVAINSTPHRSFDIIENNRNWIDLLLFSLISTCAFGSCWVGRGYLHNCTQLSLADFRRFFFLERKPNRIDTNYAVPIR